MKKILVTVAAVVLALGLSSCGGDSDAEASKELSDSIMKGQKTGDTSSLLSFDRKQADCIGSGLVDEIGSDQLKEYKLLTEDGKASKSVTDVKMSADDAESATDVLFDCTDVPAKMNEAITKSGQVQPEIRACVTKALSEEVLRDAFTSVFRGDQNAAQQKLVEPVMKCASPGGG